MELLLLREWCGVYGIPNDVVHYLSYQFYVPLLNAKKEKVLINALRERVNTFRFQESYERKMGILRPSHPATQEMALLLTDSSILLDTRIQDGRIEAFVDLVAFIIKRNNAFTTDTSYLLQKGMEIGYLPAFRVLYYYKQLKDDYAVATFVARAIQKMRLLKSWDVDHMLPLVWYYLDKKMDEPLLEWLTIWPSKLYSDPAPTWALNLDPAQEVQLITLCRKQCSPAMRNKRVNFMLCSVYAEIV